MGWRDALLRLMMRGEISDPGRSLDADAALRTLDLIDADPELCAKLDRMDNRQLRTTFLKLYRRECAQPGGDQSGD